MERELRAAILADPVLSGLLPPGAVYPEHMPQGAKKPLIIYTVHDGIPSLVAGGRGSFTRYTVTFKTFGDTYASNRALTRALISFLQGLSADLGTVSFSAAIVQNVFSDYEDNLELHTSVVDVIITTKE
jgi:hypothetical protein